MTTSTSRLVLAWTLVAAPLAYGLVQTVLKATQLFG
ncbi:MFS transporter small subunit [Egicoccus halophilus]